MDMWEKLAAAAAGLDRAQVLMRLLDPSRPIRSRADPIRPNFAPPSASCQQVRPWPVSCRAARLG